MPIDPRQVAFNNPPPRYGLEDTRQAHPLDLAHGGDLEATPRRPLDNLDIPAHLGSNPVEQWPSLGLICPEMPQAWELRSDVTEDELSAVAVLEVGGMDVRINSRTRASISSMLALPSRLLAPSQVATGAILLKVSARGSD